MTYPTKEDNEHLATKYGLRVDVHGSDLHFVEIETGETIVHSVGPLTERQVRRVLQHTYDTRRVAALGIQWDVADVTEYRGFDGGPPVFRRLPLRRSS